MEQVNSKTTTNEQKITGSGVFKLDERGRPEGIIKLAADKSLSTRPGNFTPCRRGDLQEMIAEIAREMAKYLTPPSDRDRLQELLDEFEGGLSSYLNEWGLKDIEELTPHRKKFVNKAKKIIRKSLSKGRKAPTKILRKIDTKPSQRRDALIYSMHRLFECLKKSETPYRVTDCNHYIAYILKACEVESGDAVTVFKKIKQAHHRYLKANLGLISAPQVF